MDYSRIEELNKEAEEAIEVKDSDEAETVSVEEGCGDDFSCKFVMTVLCSENCCSCSLNNCRGCSHLQECIEEGLIQ